MGMKFEIAKQNAALIHQNPDATFFVDKDGKLGAISQYNVFGRIFNWIESLGGKKDPQKVNDLILETLETIKDNINNNEFCFRSLPKKRIFSHLQDKSRVETFQTLHEDVVRSSTIAQTKRLVEVAEEIFQKSQSIIQKKSPKDMMEILEEPAYEEPKNIEGEGEIVFGNETQGDVENESEDDLNPFGTAAQRRLFGIKEKPKNP